MSILIDETRVKTRDTISMVVTSKDGNSVINPQQSELNKSTVHMSLLHFPSMFLSYPSTEFLLKDSSTKVITRTFLYPTIFVTFCLVIDRVRHPHPTMNVLTTSPPPLIVFVVIPESFLVKTEFLLTVEGTTKRKLFRQYRRKMRLKKT